jgi:hypothetical protein
MSTLLRETRFSFGAAPREVTSRDDFAPPAWMRPDDPLRSTYARLAGLLANGDVIWGHVVQAHEVLFRRGPEVAPAQVVYGASLQGEAEVLPARLRSAAAAATAIKGKKLADPAMQRISSALAAESERHGPLDLPTPLTHGCTLRMAIVVVHRACLPSHFLASSFVPLLASAARDEVALFPCRYWTDDLKEAWFALAAGER